MRQRFQPVTTNKDFSMMTRAMATFVHSDSECCCQHHILLNCPTFLSSVYFGSIHMGFTALMTIMGFNPNLSSILNEKIITFSVNNAGELPINCLNHKNLVWMSFYLITPGLSLSIPSKAYGWELSIYDLYCKGTWNLTDQRKIRGSEYPRGLNLRLLFWDTPDQENKV